MFDKIVEKLWEGKLEQVVFFCSAEDHADVLAIAHSVRQDITAPVKVVAGENLTGCDADGNVEHEYLTAPGVFHVLYAYGASWFKGPHCDVSTCTATGEAA